MQKKKIPIIRIISSFYSKGEGFVKNMVYFSVFYHSLYKLNKKDGFSALYMIV